MFDESSIAGFDLRAVPDNFWDNPRAFYAALREHAPIYKNPDGTLVLTRYADIEKIYRDPDVWSSDKKQDFAPKFGSDTPLYEHHTTSVVFTDPPDHTRIRKLFQYAFTRKALLAFRPRISDLVNGYLDKFADTGQMEVVEDFSFRLPIEVVCDMLGVPNEDRLLLRDWALAILTALEPSLTPQQMENGNRAVIEFKTYLRDLIKHRRAHPGQTQDTEVLTVMADAEGTDISELELLHACIFMLNAGHETSTNMISHGIHEMLRNPDQIKRLSDDPSLIEPMVEEVLRYNAPIQINNRRSLANTKIADEDVPAGTTVHMIIAAANHDPDQFADPSSFNIGRKPNRHLSFGLGIHVCAGNTLARLEAEIAFAELFGRFPKLGLVISPVIEKRLRFSEISRLEISAG